MHCAWRRDSGEQCPSPSNFLYDGPPRGILRETSSTPFPPHPSFSRAVLITDQKKPTKVCSPLCATTVVCAHTAYICIACWRVSKREGVKSAREPRPSFPSSPEIIHDEVKKKKIRHARAHHLKCMPEAGHL